MLSSFGCCIWWFLLGALLGWLLNRWLCACCGKKSKPTVTHAAPPPVAKAADVPAASVAPVTPKPAPAPAPAPVAAKPTAVAKPAPTAKAAKPKAPAKPKAAAKTSAKPKAAAKPKATPKAAGIDVAAAKAAGFALKNANDLTIIEGIGPKINELFVANGLKTFEQVAKATVPQMRAILDKGGARFRMANPGSWAKQASLAADNKWAALKKLQDELSGGVKK